jgi:hypothetical protein
MYRNPGMRLWYNSIMNLGIFDENKAKYEAKRFLEKSIHTLGVLLDCDVSLINEDSINPYDLESAMYYGFEILKAEIGAYGKL